MIDIRNNRIGRADEGIARRDFLRVGAASVVGLDLADWFALRARGEIVQPRAKAVIQLWMGGGPSHLDTFDPKPRAGADYAGPLRKPVAGRKAGFQVGELLPKLAQQAARYSILRGMTHVSNGHETATYIMMTGTLPSADLSYPSVGAVVGLKRSEAGEAGVLPPFITLTKPLGRFSEAGFLGNRHRTFAPGGDPNDADFRVQGLVPPKGVSGSRMQQRRSLLEAVDVYTREQEQTGAIEAMGRYQQQAYQLILGDAKEAFNLSSEAAKLRDRYGRNHFGQSCLLARRLVEHGVPFITVNMGGWDTHKDNFNVLRNRLCPPMDQGFAALLEDLDERGLLDSTIVVWMGEFGRTPRVDNDAPWFGGRGHYCRAFSAVVAGGGFQRGQVVGATDRRGEAVQNRPIYPWDLSASIYELLGINPRGKLPHPQGCTAYVTPLGSGSVQSGGLLREIM